MVIGHYFFLSLFLLFFSFLPFFPPSQLNISLSFLTLVVQCTDTCLVYLIIIVVTQIIFGEVCRICIFLVHSFLLCPIAPFQPIVRRTWVVFMAVIDVTSDLQFYITIITIRTYMHYFHNFISKYQKKRFWKKRAMVNKRQIHLWVQASTAM